MSQEPKESKESKETKETKETKEAKETKKPTNLRADAVPTDGFVLSVDGKLKTRFETSKDAMTAASKLKQSYPVIQVQVYDAAERKYAPVDLEEK
jgi:hypothetical protein